jgi:hypothetical protein
MIQLYLLILILVFIIILCNKKEMFIDGGVGSIEPEVGSIEPEVGSIEPEVGSIDGGVSIDVDKGNLQCSEDKHAVESWSGDGVHLYGCNSLYKDEPNDVSHVGIKLFWNKSDIGSSKTILIVNTSDGDNTFIKDITNEQIELDENPNTNVQQPIKTYELTHNIIEGKTYFITVNYVKPDAIYISNTLRITALSPIQHTNSSGSKSGNQNLMNLLRNKTFDIYL